MIQIKLRDILDSIPTFQKIATQEMSAKNSFLIAKILREVEKEITLYNNVRIETIKKYCNGELQTNKNGEIIIPEDKQAILQEELNKLLEETTVELNCNKIPIEAIDNMVLTPQQSSVLIDFFE